MTPLTAARAQMALSLGFHMIFAAVGMAMPILMLAAERRWMRTGDLDALSLARTWSRLTAVLFAIGAVSGTALSFELGLLWPRFMEIAGPFIGPAFALEGFAFFVEAIFLGLYLYGWNRLSPRAHWLCGLAVAASGTLSGILVLSTNAWMQDPAGFTLGADGLPATIEPWRALFNPAWPLMALHSTLATWQAVGFAAAGAYAWFLLRPRHPGAAGRHRLALRLAMVMACATALAQPIAGDLLARRAHDRQPAKLAAMEAQFITQRRAPLRIGGIPDAGARVTKYAIEIPGALSLLAAGDVDAEVKGLDAFPRSEWPNVAVTHIAFQIMVGAGFVMAALSLWFIAAWWRGRRQGSQAPPGRALLLALAACTPLGFVALEAGWIVTEVGRQPWVIQGVLRTADSVTPVPSVTGSLAMFGALYAGLLVILVFFLRHLAARGSTEA